MLRTRVATVIDESHGHREAARHFRVSPKFVNGLIKLRRETLSLLPRPQGSGGGNGKLAQVTGWIDARVNAKGEITFDALAADLGSRLDRAVPLHVAAYLEFRAFFS